MNFFRFIVIFTILILVSARVTARSLRQAVRARDLVTVQQILETRTGASLDTATDEGVTALHLAAATDQYEMVQLLLDRGASMESRTRLGFTPLHWAASRDAIRSIAVLLAGGADIDVKAHHDVTPLHWAASRDAKQAVQKLLHAGADLSARTTSGETPLHIAVRNSSSSPSAIALAAFRVATAEEDALVRYETVSPDIPRDDMITVVRPGMHLSIPVGPGKNISFVWLDTLDIWFGKYEVTNGQYRRYMPRHSSRSVHGVTLNNDDQPVVLVSWEDARRYCEWLTRYFGHYLPEGYVFRLPRESEWMYAASKGDNRKYPWGDEWPPVYGNFADESARQVLPHWRGIEGYDDGYVVTAPVMHSGMNAFGIYGLAGNVWEWVDDWYDPEKRTVKVRKGGSWDFAPKESLRISYRGMERPQARHDTIGFRVVAGPAIP